MAVAGWAGLEAVSTAVRSGRSPAKPVDQSCRIGPVQLAYLDSDPESEAPVVVLIHGSPGSSSVFRGLLPFLTGSFRVVTPDLPGFGASTRKIPDYSITAHAEYLLKLLDHLHVDSAHVVGFSMGGGVALSMVSRAPKRIASLVMLSAIGVQEHELTGSYWLNHAMHAAQLMALWSLRELAPHFGALDGTMLNVEYARNFYDTDQRPLRAVLEGYRGPMLILHGKSDRNVPVAAAMEHHRLVRQSELVLLDGNHFMTFQHPEQLAGPLVEFLKAQVTRNGKAG